MKTWWWSAQLMADGHIFNGSEWRCSDCRIRVVDLLGDRPRCESPNNDGEFVFVGGPLDGEWKRASTVTLVIPLAYGPPMLLDPDEDADAPVSDAEDVINGENAPGYVRVTYERSRMKAKGLVRYEFRG